jgi:hypothetical protein
MGINHAGKGLDGGGWWTRSMKSEWDEQGQVQYDSLWRPKRALANGRGQVAKTNDLTRVRMRPSSCLL